MIEDRKPFTVGASEENRHRNRHENVVPYDRNRVHLSPMPSLTKEINTYINASFIEVCFEINPRLQLANANSCGSSGLRQH